MCLAKCHRENEPATVAGASVTILKAFFDETFVFPNPVQPDADGLNLVPYTGPGAGMRRTMSPDAVKKFMRAAPWRPFTICMADGRAIQVPHPDFISISRTGRTVVVTNVDDEFEMIDVFLILSIKTKRAQKSSK